MAVLGSAAKPTTSQEWFGTNAVNQIAIALTLPAGGPWRIYRLGAWLAGKDEVADYKLCLWSSGGSLVRQSAQGTVASQPFVLGNAANAEFNITDYVVAGGTTVIVGFSRDPDDNTQHPYDPAGTHYHDTKNPTWPASLSGWTTHAGTPGLYLYYEASNTAPTAPTLTSPANAAILTDTTPDVGFTHNDPEGDGISFYQVQIDNNSDFSSPTWDSGQTATADTTPLVTIGVVLSRGITYYWRARTWDAAGLVGPYSSSRTLKVASLPVGTVTSPGVDTTAPLAYAAGSDTTPKLKPVWTFSCAEGGTQTSALVRVYDEAGVALQHTHSHTGSAVTAEITGYAPANGIKYQIAVVPTCSHGVQGVESGKKRCRVRWSRASYRGDLGAAPVTLSAVVSSTLNSGQVVMEFGSSALPTPEPTDWKATISEVVKQRYVWHRATLIPQVAAAPTSPALNSVVFSYSTNVLLPDNWVMAGLGSIDEGIFVYGTQSLKHTTDGTVRYTYQDVACLPDTNYVLSGRVKTVGAPGARLRVLDDTNAIVLATVSIPSDSEWAVFSTPVFNSGGNSGLRLTCYTDGATGTAWFDALKLEASKVVTPWTPGFLGKAAVLDAGGVMVDGQVGGTFRLRSNDGLGTVGLSAGGLLLDSLSDASLAGAIHPLQIGPTSGFNLAMDNNEIMARNAGAAAALQLNADGGEVIVGNNSGVGWSIGKAHALAQHKNTALSIATITYTVVTAWTNTHFDGPLLSWDGVDEIVVTKAGLYLVNLHTFWAHHVTGIRVVGIGINDVTAAAPSTFWQNRTPVTADTNADMAETTFPIALAANDRLCMKVWHNAGVAVSLTAARFSVIFLGEA